MSQWFISLPEIMIGKIVGYRMMTYDVLELILSLPEELPYKPGQRGLLSYPNDVPLKRAYSIVEYAKRNEWIELTFAIKLLPDGKGSQVLKTMKIGDTLELVMISGHFVLQDTPNYKVFIGTGTWLAPLISMAESMVGPKGLYYSVSYEKDLFYKDRILQIPNLEAHIHVSRESVPWCKVWRIDISTFLYDKETEFYLCGKPDAVKSFKDQLIEKWFSKIYTEMY